MSENQWADSRQRRDGLFSKTVNRLRSTHVGLPMAGGPVRDWNSGVFSARTMIEVESKATSSSSSPLLFSSETPEDSRQSPGLQESASPGSTVAYTPVETHVGRERANTSFSDVFDRQTHTYSFKYMVRRIEQELVRSCYFGRSIALLIVAVDTLRAIPASSEQYERERVVQAVALNLVNSVRPVDLVGRYTDERFLILCPEIDSAESKTLADGLRAACSSTVIKQEWQDLTLSISIGIANSSNEFCNLETLLASADVGADVAAQRGGNCYHCY